MYDTAIVLGMPKEKGKGTVVESYPIDSAVAVGAFAYVTSAGKLALSDSNTKTPRGIAGPVNADGNTQALIVRGMGVGVRVASNLTIAVGESVYQVNSGGAVSNSSSSATLKNAKFSSVGKLDAYDPITKAVLSSVTSQAARIDFPGGIN